MVLFHTNCGRPSLYDCAAHTYQRNNPLYITNPIMTTTNTTTSSPNKDNRRKVALKKPKMTKEERRTKYTAIAREHKAKKYQQQRDSQLTCYNCRQRGHSVNNCPQNANNNNKNGRNGNGSSSTAPQQRICYKCGSTEHALHNCPIRQKSADDALPFATCFVCKVIGHLSSQCPSNDKGVYVNGGACKHCGSVRHLAPQCPEKQKPKAPKPELDNVNVEDLLEGYAGSSKAMTGETETAGAAKKDVKKKRRVVNF